MRIVFRSCIIVLSLLDQWFFRYSMNPDGVSYLDLGDALWAGDWHSALNSYWSPLYGWIAALFVRVLHTSIAWEFPAVHLLNVIILSMALFAFEFFWSEVLTSSGVDEWSVTSQQYVWALGYLIFLRIHFELDWLGVVTPDQLVAALTYVILALLLRAITCQKKVPGWLFGTCCGFAYLAKTPMMIFGLISLAVFLIVSRKAYGSLRPFAWSLALFLLVVVPFVAAISIEHQRLTFGDAGRMNVAWHVNNTFPNYVFWRGSELAGPNAEHPVRLVNAWPAVFEFASPIKGTYPLWYDPSYWYAGADTHFSASRAIRRAVTGSRTIAGFALKEQGALVVVAAMVFTLSGNFKRAWQRWLKYWPLLVPAIAYLGVFSALIWEPRYTLAESVVLCGITAISGLADSDRCHSRILKAAAWSLGIVVCPLAIQGAMEAYSKGLESERQVKVAEALRDFGLQPGDRVAVIGNGMTAFWARLLGVRIIAEVPSNPDVGNPAAAFWKSQLANESVVLGRLVRAGAIAAIAENVPDRLPPGWFQVSNSKYAICWLKREHNTK